MFKPYGTLLEPACRLFRICSPFQQGIGGQGRDWAAGLNNRDHGDEPGA